MIIPPASFGFMHVLVIAVITGLTFFARLVFIRTSNRLLKFAAGSFVGVMIGIAVSYILAHAATPLILALQPRAGFGTFAGYRYAFWMVFITFATLGIIIGGLVGLVFTRKREEGSADASK